MRFYLILGVFTLIVLFVFLLLNRWVKTINIKHKKIFYFFYIIIYLISAYSTWIGQSIAEGNTRRAFMIYGYTVLGFCAVLANVILFYYIIKLIAYIINKKKYFNKTHIFKNGLIVLSVTILLFIFSTISAMHITEKEYTITTNKDIGEENLKIALVADTHLGYMVGLDTVNSIVDKINKQNVDLVVFAGDIVDNDFAGIEKKEQIEQKLSSIKSTYGVYGVYGNHDIDETILGGFTFYTPPYNTTYLSDFLNKCNIDMLSDEKVDITNNISIYGRRDYLRTMTLGVRRKSPSELFNNINKSKFNILLDHQPRDLDNIASYGLDLDLSGHTHNGQIFPGNIACAIGWQNSYGNKKIGNMNSIVTGGAGTWGPRIRLFTSSEVTFINVKQN